MSFLTHLEEWAYICVKIPPTETSHARKKSCAKLQIFFRDARNLTEKLILSHHFAGLRPDQEII
jgi:hypothetical protein